MHRIIRYVLQNPDPYYDIKQKFNRLMLEYNPDLKKLVDKGDNPFQMALRLAIEGNVIDYGPNQSFDINKTLGQVESMVLAIDDSESLQESISVEFREIFEQADLIISKGQGNYEGLCAVEKNIFFLLMTKCDHVANHLGVKKGDFVVKQAHD